MATAFEPNMIIENREGSLTADELRRAVVDGLKPLMTQPESQNVLERAFNLFKGNKSRPS